jgi:hypothetical protein
MFWANFVLVLNKSANDLYYPAKLRKNFENPQFLLNLLNHSLS